MILFLLKSSNLNTEVKGESLGNRTKGKEKKRKIVKVIFDE